MQESWRRNIYASKLHAIANQSIFILGCGPVGHGGVIMKSGQFTTAIYVLLAIINVGSAFKGAMILFRATKPLLMLMLIGVYITNSESILLFIILALLCAWSGDVLLLGRSSSKPGDKINETGIIIAGAGVAFILCHLLYIISFYQLGALDFKHYLPGILALVYLVIGTVLYTGLIRDFPHLNLYMKWGIVLYASIILLMSLSSIGLIDAGDWHTLLPFIGSWLFILSDYLLVLGYKINTTIYQPWVMASYLTAQLLIVLGVAAIGL